MQTHSLAVSLSVLFSCESVLASSHTHMHIPKDAPDMTPPAPSLEAKVGC